MLVYCLRSLSFFLCQLFCSCALTLRFLCAFSTYHADNKYALLSDMEKGFRVFVYLLSFMYLC